MQSSVRIDEAGCSTMSANCTQSPFSGTVGKGPVVRASPKSGRASGDEGALPPLSRSFGRGAGGEGAFLSLSRAGRLVVTQLIQVRILGGEFDNFMRRGQSGSRQSHKLKEQVQLLSPLPFTPLAQGQCRRLIIARSWFKSWREYRFSPLYSNPAERRA